MTKKYSVLTKYINLLENDNVGEWICDKENDGSAERPMHLPSNGIKWDYDSMMKADASGLDAQCILALLIASLRAERFCDGALLGFIESGAVTRWLKRLQELDEA